MDRGRRAPSMGSGGASNHRRPPSAKSVQKVLETQRQAQVNSEEEATRTDALGGDHPYRDTDRWKAGKKRAMPPTSSILDRLAGQTKLPGQIQLLSRLVSSDPTQTRRARAYAEKDDETTHEHSGGRIASEEAQFTNMPLRRQQGQRPSRRRGLDPLTVEEFDTKYASEDPMLHYMLHVIQRGICVRRVDIPRKQRTCPSKAYSFFRMDITRSLEPYPHNHLLSFLVMPAILWRLHEDTTRVVQQPEDDVLFLVYHSDPPCGFRNVYWLQWIDEDRVLKTTPDYFTLSCYGVTHYLNAIAVDFVDVDSWVMEKRAFDHMTMMRGLQKMQQLLFFLSWKRKTTRIRHHRVRARLASSLFLCDPVMSRLLLKIRVYVMAIEEEGNRPYLPAQTAFKLEHFSVLQRNRSVQVRELLRRQVQNICDVIDEDVCRLRVERMKNSSLVEQQPVRIGASSQLKDSSLCERLYGFVRLVDLQLFEAITAHTSIYLATMFRQVCGESSQLKHKEQGLDLVAEASEGPVRTVNVAVERNGNPAICMPFAVHFTLRNRDTPFPIIYAHLVEDIDFNDKQAPYDLHVNPSLLEILNVVYGILNGYISGIDGVPRVLEDTRFASISAPFTPEAKASFLVQLERPSILVLRESSLILKQMRHALETYFKQIEIVFDSHLKKLGDIKAVEFREEELKQMNMASSGMSVPLLNASQYQQAQLTWDQFATDIKTTPRVMQSGCVLLDQTPLVMKIEKHVSNRISKMMEELPYVYKQFLSDLLCDVDGRVDHVTKIPTSIPEAIFWLRQVLEMMPSHPFRKSFDQKCSNLLTLKAILKEQNLRCRQPCEQEELRKLDIEWESIYETLIICLTRVEERDSEHRRSVGELSSKTMESIELELEATRESFHRLPTCEEELHLVKRKLKDLEIKKQDILDSLERLVELDEAREEMNSLYAIFKYEYRLMADQHTDCFESQEPPRPSVRGEKRAPEVLLQHVSTVFDVRSWYSSWIKLESKWLDSPLTSIHPSTVLARIKQFRRRLQYASSRLISTFSDQNQEFVAHDLTLLNRFQQKIADMAEDYRVFLAVSRGTFTPERWHAVQVSLGIDTEQESNYQSKITLRMIKARWHVAPDDLPKFQNTCDLAIIEARIFAVLERVSKQLSQCCIVLQAMEYQVKIINIRGVILELEDLEVEATLSTQSQLPNVENARNILEAVSAKRLLCDRINEFQERWDLLCEITRLHDVDEFFTGQIAWKSGQPLRDKKNSGKDEVIWNEFVDTGQAWGNCLRRVLCMNTSITGSASVLPRTQVACPLDDLAHTFRGFDFTISTARCEAADRVVDKYLDSLRERCPRLYLMTKKQLLQFIVNGDNISGLRTALAICYPLVQRFCITQNPKQYEETEQGSQLSTPNDASTSNTLRAGIEPVEPIHLKQEQGPISIIGISSFVPELDMVFNVPVIKIGRLKFWMARVEEELSSTVNEDLKAAVAAVLQDTAVAKSPDSQYMAQPPQIESFLPQSLTAAVALYFTSLLGPVFGQLSGDLRALDFDLAIQTVDQVMTRLYAYLVACTKVLLKPSCIAHRDPRIEAVILQVRFYVELLQELRNLGHNGRFESIALWWDTVFKLYLQVEDISSKSVRRFEEIDLDKWSDVESLGATFPISFVWRIQHMEFTIGRDYQGMYRLPVISPLTQRCMFAVVRALSVRPVAFVAPTSERCGDGKGSIVKAVAQLFGRASVEVNCSSTGEVPTLDKIGSLLRFITMTDSFLVLRYFSTLTIAVSRVIQAKVIKVVHDETVCPGRSIFDSGHQSSDLRYMSRAAAIFIPMTSREFASSHLFKTTSTEAFNPVSVCPPTIPYFVESLAVVVGYSLHQTPSVRDVIMFFEGLDCMLSSCTSSVSIFQIVSSIMAEVTRLRVTSRVILPATSASTQWCKSSAAASAVRRGKAGHLFRKSTVATDTSEVVVHTLFRTVIERMLVTDRGAAIALGRVTWGDVESLLDGAFPGAKGCELSEKAHLKEDAMWDALEMCLDQSGLAENVQVLRKCAELWLVLERQRTVVVYGDIGSGKTVCIKTLHHALCALEMTPFGGNDEATPRNAPSELQFISPHLIGLEPGIGDFECDEQLLTEFFKTASRVKHDLDASSPISQRKWLCVDGVLTTTWTNSFMTATAAQGPHGHSPLKNSSPRLILETSSLADISPASAVCSSFVYIPKCISQRDIVASWSQIWSRKLQFPTGSRGAENLDLIFRALDQFLAESVRLFILEEEGGRSLVQSSSSRTTLESLPSHIGVLSLNHVTHACLTLISSMCFRHRSQLEELPSLQVIRLVAFSVIWGAAGHLNDVAKQKLDVLIRADFKMISEIRHLGEIPGLLFDSEQLGDYWDGIQLTLHSDRSEMSDRNATLRVMLDPELNRLLVLPRALVGSIRIARLLIQSSRSFLIAGPRGSGKTTMLRILWQLDEEDRAAETMADASLKQRFPTGVLNWLHKPATWFSPPPRGGNLGERIAPRCRARDDADLFAPPHSSKSVVFIDDIGMNAVKVGSETPAKVVNALDEFARVAVDHRVGMCWSEQRVKPLEKAVGGALCLPGYTGFSQRLPSDIERVVRQFSVLHMPMYDRSQLASIFRPKFREFTLQPDVSRRSHPGAEHTLTPDELILRASVDVAVDVLIVQQSSEQQELLNGFTFNLHHLSALVERSIGFLRVQQSQNNASGMKASDVGTSLLSLGKLHQCWISEIRNIFLMPCMVRRSATMSTTCPAVVDSVVAGDELKKTSSTLRATSEKYFSVPVQENETQVTIANEVVYFAYTFCFRHPAATNIQRERLSELITSNASAGVSSSRCHRKSQTTVQSRGEYTVDAVRAIILEHVNAARSHVKPATLSEAHAVAADEMKLQLHLSSSLGLHQLLHAVHAIALGKHMIVAQSIRPGIEQTLRWAYQLEQFDVIELSPYANGPQNALLRSPQEAKNLSERLEDVCIAAGTLIGRRVSLWVDLCDFEDRFSEDAELARESLAVVRATLLALCFGHSLPMVFTSQRLRDAIVTSCVQLQANIEVLTEERAIALFHQRISRNLRVCVFTPERIGTCSKQPKVHDASFLAFVALLKSSAFFQWYEVALLPLSRTELYLVEASEQAMQEIIGTPLSVSATRETASLQANELDWLPSACVKQHTKRELTAIVKRDSVNGSLASREAYLSLLNNLVIQYRQRLTLVHNARSHREVAVHAFTWVNERVQLLILQVHRILAQIEELTTWRAELITLLELQQRREQELAIQVPGDTDGTSEQSSERARAKVKKKIWAVKAMRAEYDLNACELRSRLREITTEVRDWDSVQQLRKKFETQFRTECDALTTTGTLNHPTTCDRSSLAHWAMLMAKRMAYPTVEASRSGCEDGGDGSISEIDPLAAVAQTVIDGDPSLVKRAWTARFPFLALDRQCELLWVADAICDRVPLFVDSTGLMQDTLIELVSGASYFDSLADKQLDLATINMINTGMVIVHCDDTDKMCRQLEDAAQRDLPVLVVGMRDDLMPLLIPFCRIGRQRRPILAELTLEAIRIHVKQTSEPIAPNPTVLAKSLPHVGINTSKPALTPTTPSAIHSAGVRSGQRRHFANRDGISVGEGGSTAATANASSELPAAHKRHGFQLYAVATSALSLDVQRKYSASLVCLPVQWERQDIESFFLETYIRKQNSKLYRELQDLRRMRVELAVQAAEMEAALWPLAIKLSKQTPPTTIDRAKFLSHLSAMDRFQSSYSARMSWLMRRADLLDMRRCQAAQGIACIISQLAICINEFGSALPPPIARLYLRSCTFLSRQLEHAIAASRKTHLHTCDLPTQQLRQQPRQEQEQRQIVSYVLRAVLSSFLSDAHRELFMLCLTVSAHSQAKEQPGVRGVLNWMFMANDMPWWRGFQRIQVSYESNSTASTRTASFANRGELSTAPSPVRGTPSVPLPRSNNLVERLRRKVRVCSLMLDHVAVARSGKEQSRQQQPESGTQFDRSLPMIRGGEGNPENVEHNDGLVNEVERRGSSEMLHESEMVKSFRRIATTTKILWCKWKLAREHQRIQLLHSLQSLITSSTESASPVKLRALSMGHRRHNSLKSLSLPSVTGLTLQNVLQLYGVADAMAGDADGLERARVTQPFPLQLARVMIAKVLFPQALHSEVVALIHASEQVGDAIPHLLSTSQILGVDAEDDEFCALGSVSARISISDGAFTNPGGDTTTHDPDRVEQVYHHHVMPPPRDFANRRDELVHLPTRVLLYEDHERLQTEIVLRRAAVVTNSTTPRGALRMLTVHDITTSRSSLLATLTDAITSRTRFAIEILQIREFEPVVSLVSQLINQHALLCIPEWYIVCSFEVLSALRSGKLAGLHLHVVTSSAETRSLSFQLALALETSYQVTKADAAVASWEIIERIQRQPANHERAPFAVSRPLSCELDEWMHRYKSGSVAERGERAAQRRRSSIHREDDITSECSSDAGEQDGFDSCNLTHTASVTPAQRSLALLADCLLLGSMPPTKTDQNQERDVDSCGADNGSEEEEDRGTREEPPTNAHAWRVPRVFQETISQLHAIIQAVHDQVSDKGKTTTTTWSLFPWWSLGDECKAVLQSVTSFQSRLAPASYPVQEGYHRQQQQELALVANGIVPYAWIVEMLPHLQAVCAVNIIRIPQLLVLLVARVGFVLHTLHEGPSQSINLALCSDPVRLLSQLRREYARSCGCPREDVVFALEWDSPEAPADESDKKQKSSSRSKWNSALEATKASVLQARIVSKAMKPVIDGGNNAAPNALLYHRAVVLDTANRPCGFQVQDLVVVERIQRRGAEERTLIHTVPPCRFVVRRSVEIRHMQSTIAEKHESKQTGANLRRSSLASSETRVPQSIPASLRETRLVAMASTSRYQPQTEGTWPLSKVLAERVALTFSLFKAVPSLTPARDNEEVEIELGVPIFTADDDEEEPSVELL